MKGSWNGKNAGLFNLNSTWSLIRSGRIRAREAPTPIFPWSTDSPDRQPESELADFGNKLIQNGSSPTTHLNFLYVVSVSD